MILYLYSKCSTCQEAVAFLNAKGCTFKLKEIVNERPTVEELQQMLTFQGGHLTKLLNTSGQLYRQMNFSELVKQKPLSEILTLLNQHGMLIKRPFLLADSFGLTGFKEKLWTETFSRL